MKNKKKIILGSIIGILLGLLISTSYAIFSYNKVGENNKLIAGDIYMHYNETNTLNELYFPSCCSLVTIFVLSETKAFLMISSIKASDGV